MCQAFPAAVTKWRRNDKDLPSSRVNHKHEEGRHIIEISRPRQVNELNLLKRTRVGLDFVTILNRILKLNCYYIGY